MSEHTNQFGIEMEHDDPVVAETATMLQNFANLLEAGEMSEAEYKELALDLLDMQRVEDAVDDLERRTAISKAFQQLLKIVNTIRKIV